MAAHTDPLALEAAYDDPEEPSQVTVYPPDGDCRTTCWLTASVDDAVALSAMI